MKAESKQQKQKLNEKSNCIRNARLRIDLKNCKGTDCEYESKQFVRRACDFGTTSRSTRRHLAAKVSIFSLTFEILRKQLMNADLWVVDERGSSAVSVRKYSVAKSKLCVARAIKGSKETLSITRAATALHLCSSHLCNHHIIGMSIWMSTFVPPAEPSRQRLTMHSNAWHSKSN